MIDARVLAEIDDIARELHASRRYVVGLALEQYLRRREKRRIEEQMDAALSGISETAEDRQARAAIKRKQKVIAGRETW